MTTERGVEITVEELFAWWNEFQSREPKEGPEPDWDNPGSIQSISLCHIAPGDNYRKTIEIAEIVTLAGTFESHDQLEVIKLLRRGKVWSGHRRCLAAIYRYCQALRRDENATLSVPVMRCELVTREMSEEDEAIGAILHNERVNPNPVEEALEYQRIMTTYGRSERDLAIKIAGPDAWESKFDYITRRLSLLNLSTKDGDGFPLLENVAAGRISISDGEMLATLPKLKQRTAASTGFTGKTLAQEIKRLKELRGPSESPVAVAGQSFVSAAPPAEPLSVSTFRQAEPSVVQSHSSAPSRPAPPLSQPSKYTSLGGADRRHFGGAPAPRALSLPPAPASNARTYTIGKPPDALEIEVETARRSASVTVRRLNNEPMTEEVLGSALIAIGDHLKKQALTALTVTETSPVAAEASA